VEQTLEDFRSIQNTLVPMEVGKTLDTNGGHSTSPSDGADEGMLYLRVGGLMATFAD
jgi:hypothetical protein